MTDSERVAQMLMKWRRDAEWSRKQLSVVLRSFRGLELVSEGMIQRWETRTHRPQRRYMEALEAAERRVGRRVEREQESISYVKDHPEIFARKGGRP